MSRSPDPGWVPEWARRAVFYHIYPLGFFGAPAENPRSGPPAPRLYELLGWLDHIQELGATAIYLGPIFESERHGYDTIDYFSVDRRLGDVTLFKEVVGEIHRHGLKVILDGVFNHTGREFFAFKDILEKRSSSPYVGWYFIDWHGNTRYNDGFGYPGWGGHASLPKLNLANPEVRAYLFEVARMWLGDVGADGWRLDAAGDIDPGFWWEFRRVCKQVNPECFLVGELVHGDYRKWVAPDLLDSGTNYQLYDAIWRSLNDRNYWNLKSMMDRSDHPQYGVYADILLFNFIGNHDVARILSRLKEPRHVYPALIFLLTTRGIPCLYYGDEAGLRGRKEDGDPALRTPMPRRESWPDREGHIFRAISRLARIRREHPALYAGDFDSLETAPTLYSYIRRAGSQVAVVALNSGTEAASLSILLHRHAIPDGTVFRDVLDDEGRTFTVQGGKLALDRVWPGWGRVLIAAR